MLVDRRPEWGKEIYIRYASIQRAARAEPFPQVLLMAQKIAAAEASQATMTKIHSGVAVDMAIRGIQEYLESGIEWPNNMSKEESFFQKLWSSFLLTISRL